jgi:hypothetical protein
VALTNAEVQTIRRELGYPNYDNAAAAYVGTEALFEQVIQPYLLGSAQTTSSTPVTAALEPTPQTLTLASATGFAAGDVVIVDVDARQERATISHLSGTAATVQLSLAHSGTYPVVLEGVESAIRDILKELRLIAGGMNGNKSELTKMLSHLGIKKIEGEIEWFGGGGSLASQGIDPLTLLTKMRESWRDELASVLNIPRLNGRNGSGGTSISVY